MSSQQRRGFRLPWGAERGPDGGPGAVMLEAEQLTAEPPASESQLDSVAAGDPNVVTDALGDARAAAEAAPALSTDAVPEASDVPEPTAEAAMIDMERTPSLEPASDAAPETGTAEAPSDGAWPTTDAWQAANHIPEPDEDQVARRLERLTGHSGAATPPPTNTIPRRENPLVAGLVKAMREAAVASREETTGRLQAEASARIEAIRERATGEAADLRKRADEDVATIRDWGKSEIARIRQETDAKVETRKSELDAETMRHADGVDHLVDQVQATVAAFEADMDGFFEQLLAENDPARLATLAEQAPEPPDLTGDAPTALGWAGSADDTAFTSEPGSPTGAAALEADAAAEAEAAATDGLDLPADDGWPVSVLAAARRADAAPAEGEADGLGHLRLLVSGLTSVAAISAFKGAVGQAPGVRSVSVSSGEPGVFIFAVAHDAEADLRAAVSDLPGFATTITDDAGDSFSVTAHEVNA